MLSRMEIVLIALALACSAAAVPSANNEGARVFGAYYFADRPFPEFTNLWSEGWSLATPEGEPVTNAAAPLGGYVFVYVENTSAAWLNITDLEVDGVKLSEGLGQTSDGVGDMHGYSVLKSKLPKEQIDALMAAGQPVWWKAEPRTLAPRGTSQIVLRLRRNPKADSVKIGVVTERGRTPAVVTKKPQPRFAAINFSPELDTVYLYLRHPGGPGMKPDRVYMDGVNMTQSCQIAACSTTDVAPIVLKLPQPLEVQSYHCFRVGYPDGSAATYGIRAWGYEFGYGMWGSRGEARAFLRDLALHNVNLQMPHASKEVMHISLDDEGYEFIKSLGIRQMATWTGNARNPLYYFLQDEPDAKDYSVDDLPPLDRLGCLGQGLVYKQEGLRAKDPKTPILLNIDNTYKPENWYMYHQLADIPCIDPYYPEQIDGCYRKYPSRFGANTKPTYVYAASAISQSSCAPKPLHVILCSTQYQPKMPADYVGRCPTPEEKRMEVYYAIGAGAKGISYWWFAVDGECNGVGSDDPAAKALWKEIGLLGAEVRTAGPVIIASCPASLPVKAPRLLMVRTLISGLDTVAVVAVNDNVLSDRVGTVFRPLEKAPVTVDVPSWMQPVDVFEVSYLGTRDVVWSREASKVKMELGPVNLSRFVIITGDGGLRARLQQLYDSKFKANVAQLTSAD